MDFDRLYQLTKKEIAHFDAWCEATPEFQLDIDSIALELDLFLPVTHSASAGEYLEFIKGVMLKAISPVCKGICSEAFSRFSGIDKFPKNSAEVVERNRKDFEDLICGAKEILSEDSSVGDEFRGVVPRAALKRARLSSLGLGPEAADNLIKFFSEDDRLKIIAQHSRNFGEWLVQDKDLQLSKLIAERDPNHPMFQQEKTLTAASDLSFSVEIAGSYIIDHLFRVYADKMGSTNGLIQRLARDDPSDPGAGPGLG